MNRTILAANWKMYLNEDTSIDFIKKMSSDIESCSNSEVILFPSHTCISQVQKELKNLNDIKIGMQDCDIHTKGAYTGGVSLHGLSHIDFCIVGHSERRLLYNESDEVVKNKLETVISNGVNAILCVGETKEQKNDGNTFTVIDAQLSILPKDAISRLTIAYEPVWSIGSGEVPSNRYIEDVLSYIKNKLKSLYSDEIVEKINLLYGGSVDKDNINRLLEVKLIDGFLIGSASADFESFKAIADKLN